MTRLLEGCVDAVLDHLQRDLPSRVEGLDAPAPLAWFDGEKGRMNNFPAVFVLGDRTVKERHGQNWIDATHELRIRVAVKGPDAGQLRRHLYRYQDAIWASLTNGYFSGPLSDYVIVADDNHRGGRDPEWLTDEVPPEARDLADHVMSGQWTITFNKQHEEFV